MPMEFKLKTSDSLLAICVVTDDLDMNFFAHIVLIFVEDYC